MTCVTAPLVALMRLASMMGGECTVKVSDGGWSAVCTDAAKVAMVTVDTPPGTVPGMPDCMFSVKCDEALKALSRRPEAEVTVGDGFLEVGSDGLVRRMRLLQPENPRRIPDLKLPAMAMTEADMLRDVMLEFTAKRMQSVTLSVGPDGLTASVGDEVDRVSQHIGADRLLAFDGEATAAYPLEYWQDLVRTLPRDTVIEMSMDTDYPVAVSFSMDGAEARWIVAPRIEG